jgi:hypothetical protein
MFAGFDDAFGKNLTEDLFLRPYLEKLRELTPHDSLERIVELDRAELILLHHSYGMGVRNSFIHGDREPELVRFFEVNGVQHSDTMGGILVEALWRDLNNRLSPEQRATIE